MGKITSITVQKNKKERANLFIDGEFKAGLSMETVYKLRLKVGDIIDDKKLLEIIGEEERVSAINKAAGYVSKAMKTKKQVKDYLLKKGFSEEIAYSTIDKLKEYGYVDDEDYAKRFLDATCKTQGKRLVAFKLMQKGVKKEDIENAYADRDESIDEENAKLLAEKYLRNKEINKENVLKAYKYLIGRGFSYEQAEYAIKDFKEDF